MNNQTEIFTRAAYMSFSSFEYTAEERMKAHRKYYAQFVNAAVIEFVVYVIGKDKILASTDPHMNDIPLKLWDNMHTRLPLQPGIFQKLTGSNFYSMSDSICIAKEAAKQYQEQHKD